MTPGTTVRVGLRAGTITRLQRRNGIDGALIDYPNPRLPSWVPLTSLITIRENP